MVQNCKHTTFVFLHFQEMLSLEFLEMNFPKIILVIILWNAMSEKRFSCWLMNQKALPVRVCDFLSVIFLQPRDVLSVSFPFVLEIEKKTLLLVYRCQCSTGFWLLVILILDKCCLRMLPKLILQSFNLSQHWQYLSHVHGALLDLVFDTSNSNAVSSLPSPYSDHFFPFFFQIW